MNENPSQRQSVASERAYNFIQERLEAVMDNRTLAQRLIRLAHDLESAHASLFRIRAYRRAAETILGLDRPIADIVAQTGRRGLSELPGIGRRLSGTIESMVRDPQLQ
jgi:DNA polymerase (family 10)